MVRVNEKEFKQLRKLANAIRASVKNIDNNGDIVDDAADIQAIIEKCAELQNLALNIRYKK